MTALAERFQALDAQHCPWCGSRTVGACALPKDGVLVCAEMVVCRLEEAMRTLAALPAGGGGQGYGSSWPPIVRKVMESYARDRVRVRRPVPEPAAIDRMDVAFRWLALVPSNALRRIVAARSMVDPATERHEHSWRQIGAMIGADYRAVQRWHRQGIDHIVRSLLHTDQK